ncbi:sodium:proton antiporter (plasmid) [Pseudorhodobacter turbinis]|uniref:Sodium:proton antiporter n=1 Tax=Pseudorhodobacter turbinis TaxID=2500533 RepID=A0A4P8EJP3_9RHOB|nr:sodium:proton antiporter [Pseudorhodobacter turbinis]QCO57072.1 sodium:proton antiporter [Pseudorhodobacter turbinis]
MAVESAGLSPVEAFALVGVIGVGAQWLAWRIQMPAIVLMLLAGLIVGPVTGVFIPSRDIGDLVGPMISVAVAVILFEGGLTLNFHALQDAAKGVRRLVIIGAPLGWLTSALAVHYGAGLGWGASAVFGGIMIVTGPTVIAPLLRQARLSRRPAALLQWEAIVNDPVGALAAVLAFAAVQVLATNSDASDAAVHFFSGIFFATLTGLLAGRGIAYAFRRGLVPEYMKIPVLFVVLLGAFALTDRLMHESGLLAVTVMGLVIANAQLPSYEELRRFKEHATILLVSGVFILLAAGLKMEALLALDLRAVLFVLLVVLVARPFTVMVALLGTDLPMKERVLVAFTGPRGVVLMAVAGLFGERLVGLGIADGAAIGPLAFALVASTVVINGFGLTPLASLLGLRAAEVPGVLLVGGTRLTAGLGAALQKAEIPVLITDMNLGRLRLARAEGLPVFYGDILSEAAESQVEFIGFSTIFAATDNDSYNTLVATDLAPEFGRDKVWQLPRDKSESQRHSLPVTLGGRRLGDGRTYHELEALLIQGWTVRTTKLTEEYGFEDWRNDRPESVLLCEIPAKGDLRLVAPESKTVPAAGSKLIAISPPKADAA